MKKILIINGSNINMIGVREKTIYGSQTIADINDEIINYSKKLGIEVEIFQSNSEGSIIDKIHDMYNNCDGIILNLGAYTHYSYSIRDAIAAVKLPCIEVHLSNIYAREEFRAKSVILPVCIGQICGFGKESYILAIDAILKIIN